MNRGRRNHLTGQVAEHLVCAELGRLGLAATGFAGNVPTFDIIAADEQCRTVPIQVKATNSDNWPSDARQWMDITLEDDGVQRLRGPTQLTTPDLIYVCVAIAPPRSLTQDCFFILTMAELQSICIAGYSAWMTPKGWRRPRNQASFDCRYDIKQIAPFKNNWSLITDRLAVASPRPLDAVDTNVETTNCDSSA